MNPAHLRWDTRSNNMFDKARDGTLPSQRHIRRRPRPWRSKVIISFPPDWTPPRQKGFPISENLAPAAVVLEPVDVFGEQLELALEMTRH